MLTPGNTTVNSSKWQDLNQPKLTDDRQLENIESYLDLVLLALEAIADVDSKTIIETAKDLNLELGGKYRMTLENFPSENTQLKNNQDSQKITIELIKSLVLIICYLANQHQELLRRAVSLLEQITEPDFSLQQTSLLNNYLNNFISSYQVRIANNADKSQETSSELAWKLLISLLFYSGHNGHSLLWTAIFDLAEKSS
jgi:hypothetical protein